MEKQTAVEWQAIELMRINFEYSTNKITPREFQEQIKYTLEKAKEMEKQQIIDAYKFGLSDEYVIGSEQYYNETFGKL
jgi:hypothetical protein